MDSHLKPDESTLLPNLTRHGSQQPNEKIRIVNKKDKQITFSQPTIKEHIKMDNRDNKNNIPKRYRSTPIGTLLNSEVIKSFRLLRKAKDGKVDLSRSQMVACEILIRLNLEKEALKSTAEKLV